MTWTLNKWDEVLFLCVVNKRNEFCVLIRRSTFSTFLKFFSFLFVWVSADSLSWFCNDSCSFSDPSASNQSLLLCLLVSVCLRQNLDFVYMIGAELRFIFRFFFLPSMMWSWSLDDFEVCDSRVRFWGSTEPSQDWTTLDRGTEPRNAFWAPWLA